MSLMSNSKTVEKGECGILVEVSKQHRHGLSHRGHWLGDSRTQNILNFKLEVDLFIILFESLFRYLLLIILRKITCISFGLIYEKLSIVNKITLFKHFSINSMIIMIYHNLK